MIDVLVGFQFEFFCENCGEILCLVFKFYCKGQIIGWLSCFVFLFYDLNKVSCVIGVFVDVGGGGVKVDVLVEVMVEVVVLYECCLMCCKWVGCECWNSSSNSCCECVVQLVVGVVVVGYGVMGIGLVCFNCQMFSEGGCFCYECGFDMVSMYKSCFVCGVIFLCVVCFCIDCGYGF